jgi:hypothetical protein
MEIPQFENKAELSAFLIANKSLLIQSKRAQIKHSDVVTTSPTLEVVDKAEKGDPMTIKAVINTIGVLDSHGDVHMKGIWNKTVREKKNVYLLQEHQMTFDKIISDDVKASVQQMSWKELGVKAEGGTEALVFEAKIDEERNPFMVKQYRNGWVKNHSVGMQYVKIKMAVNDPELKEEYEEWNKAIDSILNKEVAEKMGYFFTVYEAKMFEGSAVPIGSNRITPTLESNLDKDTDLDASSQKEKPSADTSLEKDAEESPSRKQIILIHY